MRISQRKAKIGADMNSNVRMILGIVAGVVVGGLVVFLVESAGHAMFPPPVGTDLSNPEAMKTLIVSLPAGGIVMLLLGWFLGALAGAVTAKVIAKREMAAWIVGVIFVALTASNFIYIPHPVWMMAAGVALPLLAAWIATRMRRSTDVG